jgi:hypothetical protein
LGEGFLSTPLKKNIKIEHIPEREDDWESDYFHRMLYGVLKAVTEYISMGKPYSGMRKIFLNTLGGDFISLTGTQYNLPAEFLIYFKNK